VEECEEIERSNNEAHEAALNFDPSLYPWLVGKDINVNLAKDVFWSHPQKPPFS